jgi:hypothetical protein
MRWGRFFNREGDPGVGRRRLLVLVGAAAVAALTWFAFAPRDTEVVCLAVMKVRIIENEAIATEDQGAPGSDKCDIDVEEFQLPILRYDCHIVHGSTESSVTVTVPDGYRDCGWEELGETDIPSPGPTEG